MKKLETTDIFSGIRLLKKLGLREKAEQLARNSDTIDDVWANGFEFLWDLFDTATEAGGEAAVYAFLSGPFEMTPEQVKHLELPELIKNLKQLAEENDLTSFFSNAAGVILKK